MAKQGRSPFEFLYIDVDRVGAYWAQLKGGAFAKQRLSQKIVNTASGGLEVPGAKASASTQEENFVEREVTPTTASSFVELEEELKDELEKEFLRNFHSRITKEREGKKLEDGDFVSFESEIESPLYLSPYLAVHRAATVSALIPMPARATARRRKAVKLRREAAKKFHKQVGKNPRVILTIQPEQPDGRESAKYLLPIHVRQLNDERSLLRSGGTFTVVGKVVRLFPRSGSSESGDQRPSDYSYVDSPTRQIWTHPLKHAPKELICRTNFDCAEAVQGRNGVRGPFRQKLIREARRRMLRELKNGTQIESSGAVIIPVAIYK